MFQGCPKGTFKPLIGPRTCTPCPEYSTSMDGSTSPEHCVCQHGEFQIMSDQERKCQRYENEELVRLGKETNFLWTLFTFCDRHFNLLYTVVNSQL